MESPNGATVFRSANATHRDDQTTRIHSIHLRLPRFPATDLSSENGRRSSAEESPRAMYSAPTARRTSRDLSRLPRMPLEPGLRPPFGWRHVPAQCGTTGRRTCRPTRRAIRYRQRVSLTVQSSWCSPLFRQPFDLCTTEFSRSSAIAITANMRLVLVGVGGCELPYIARISRRVDSNSCDCSLIDCGYSRISSISHRTTGAKKTQAALRVTARPVR